MKFKEEFKPQFILLNCLINEFANKLAYKRKVVPCLNEFHNVEEYDKQIEQVNFSMFDFADITFADSRKKYLDFLIFLNSQRTLLLTKFKITETVNYISQPQQKVFMLTSEALESVGNNKLNITENQNEYSLLYR